MNSSVLTALAPVVCLIALGVAVGKLQWVRRTAVRDLSQLVFYVLTPALLFRTMVGTRLADLDFSAIGVYFLAAGLVFGATLLCCGLTTLAAARALGHTFSNTVMIGIPLTELVWGSEGLVTLFTLISLHTPVLMTVGTVVFELAAARQTQESGGRPPLWRTVLRAVKHSVLHPVPIPIIAGLLYGHIGWPLPDLLDQSLALLGQALGPVSLLLVGITLSYSQLRGNVGAALRMALVKLLVMPAVFCGCAWLLGLRGVPMAAMALAAALPVGANVLLFTQRYQVGEDEVSASIALSTGLALLTLPLWLLLLAQWR